MAKVETMTHDALEAWSLEYLNRIPCSYAYPTHGGERRKPRVPGVADIDNVRRGIAHYYEIKIGRDRLSEDQTRFRDRVRTAGGHWYVIRSPEDLVAAVAAEDLVDAKEESDARRPR
jgi:hypothetical protein